MILSDRRSGAGINIKRLLKAVPLLMLLALLVWLFWPKVGSEVNGTAADGSTYFCNAEEVKGEFFVNGEQQFDKGHMQSSELPYSGKYSCRIETGEGLQYGFSYTIPNVQPGDVYHASVWRNKPYGGEDGFLVASAEGDGKFYKSEFLHSKADGDWEQIQFTFSIPIQKKVDQVKVYVYTLGKAKMFFDDLKIVKTKSLVANADFVPRPMNIELKDKAMEKLRTKQRNAFRRGLLISEEDDWVKANIIDPVTKEATKVELRLKGDWLDHVSGNKWSFRIKARTGESWNRMRIFSIQTPKARSFLREWILHQLYLKEDILTTRYDFSTVTLNKEPIGIFAVEEHFDKVLLEYRHRREGPIIKFTEEGFWQGINRQFRQIDGLDHDLEQSVMMAETSEIAPFQEGKTLKSDPLAKQYELAQTLLNQYRYGLKPAGEIFDLDVLARYYAISDMLGAYHGISWHNQRFYYNPVTGKIEPIGYDGYGSYVEKRNFIRGQGAFNIRKLDMEELDNKLFLDKDFTEKYVAYLYHYSSREYVEAFMAEIQEGLNLREELLRQEFKNYKFNFDDFVRNIQRVNLLLLPYNDLSLKTYTQATTTKGKRLKIANTHSLPVELVGYGPRQDLMTDTLEKPFLLEAFVPRLVKTIADGFDDQPIQVDTFTGKLIWQAYRSQEFLSFRDLEVRNSAKYLFFKPLGVDSVFHNSISAWQAPFRETPPQKLLRKYPLKEGGAYEMSKDMLYFRKGKHRITEPIVIPRGYRVIFEAGAELDIVNKALFLSYSPVFMYGTESEPIYIHSSDQSGAGFTVIQAKGESRLHFVRFEHLNTLARDGWGLTGAVTFYESKVEISKCEFYKNHCEDALNIIRSEFSLTASLISDTYADGLDADFCKGYIDGCRFQNTANDGLDLSGSVIMVDKCVMDGCKDKGISVGEESDVTIMSAEIKGSPIAIAAKDLSTLLINRISIRDCDQGFTAYQKKPEYGGGKIIVKSYSASGVKRLYNIRKNSLLQLKERMIEGE